MSSQLIPIIGMETHAELKTQSKMFCGCKNDPFHAKKPNIYTCPVCLGLPGALPFANKKAIEWTIKLGLALGCEINLFSKFDRKNYFYPDLPKGYQISQYDLPFCINGILETEEGPVRIRRIHLEEDTGKLQHTTINGKKVSLIDFNRSSVPLVEIVTEPDIHSARHAKEYGKKLRQILRYLDISDCNMEQGSLRLEANISLSKNANVLPNYKAEVKNINSFGFLEKAINFEIERQTKILEKGETPAQETRGWSEAQNATFSQRTKEDAEDYRYFPDPDLPPLQFTKVQIDQWKLELPELPKQLQIRWKKEFGIEEKYTTVLADTPELARQFEKIITITQTKKLETNHIANLVVNKKLSNDLLNDPEKLIAKYQELTQVDEVDTEELNTVILEVLSEQSKAVSDYQAGKTQILGFLIGQVMKKIGKKIDPKIVQQAIQKHLS
ncbi:MAG: Asp-tRNA(Asn)/Glu-tRNA(Gln) amidotransferase subunit GatB [Patescibacteria group bacterium]